MDACTRCLGDKNVSPRLKVSSIKWWLDQYIVFGRVLVGQKLAHLDRCVGILRMIKLGKRIFWIRWVWPPW